MNIAESIGVWEMKSDNEVDYNTFFTARFLNEIRFFSDNKSIFPLIPLFLFLLFLYLLSSIPPIPPIPMQKLPNIEDKNMKELHSSLIKTKTSRKKETKIQNNTLLTHFFYLSQVKKKLKLVLDIVGVKTSVLVPNNHKTLPLQRFR